MRKRREAEIQEGILHLLRLRGVPASPTDASRSFGPDGLPRRNKVYPGWPDISATIHRGYNVGRSLYMEIKSKRGKVSDVQRRTLNTLERAGALVYVVRSVNEANQILDRILGPWDGKVVRG